MRKIISMIIVILLVCISTRINANSSAIFSGNNYTYIKGDIDNDGRVTVDDLSKLKLHLIGVNLLEEQYLSSADLDDDKKISVNDMAYLKLILLGLKDSIQNITVDDTSFSGFEFKQITPINTRVTYKEYQFVNDVMLESYPGITGAGSQWPDSMEVSETGDLMLYGVDVAGLYKSLDHGKTWQKGNKRDSFTWCRHDGNRP